MIKLNYKKINICGHDILYAKYRKNKHIRLSVDSGGVIKLTAPYLCSEKEIAYFVNSKIKWIESALEKQLSKKPLLNNKKLSVNEKNILKNTLSHYVAKYENLMDIKINNFTIRNMKTLWGSCSYKERTIRFNSKLFFMSNDFIEYIVLHEMTHIFVPNHSTAFYAIVKKFLPNYKQIWKEHKLVSLK